MKLCDFIFQFFQSPPYAAHGICRVRLFVSPTNAVVALLTDLDSKNPGGSVTNRVETIRTQLVKRGFITTDALIVEHYEASTFRLPTFDHVTFSKDDRPAWRPMSLEEAQVFIGVGGDELNSTTLDDDRLLTEIDQIRHAIDPAAAYPALARRSVITRKLEIERTRIAMTVLRSRIDAGDGEKALQHLLKSDLSILGEMYSVPPDEYVCFAEYPLGGGFVDFVVISGRSRMEVVLVEIKGADFHLVNGDSYMGFARKINHAADQIRQRLGYAYRHHHAFRTEIHRALQDVESGRSVYSSFRGPQDRLHVDPEKDINIRAVVIGGRTQNDREESRKRHEYEMHFVPSIKIESWDTWLRKLQRR